MRLPVQCVLVRRVLATFIRIEQAVVLRTGVLLDPKSASRFGVSIATAEKFAHRVSALRHFVEGCALGDGQSTVDDAGDDGGVAVGHLEDDETGCGAVQEVSKHSFHALIVMRRPLSALHACRSSETEEPPGERVHRGALYEGG